MRNLSYENEFCMQFHFHANQSHFHKNSFALRLALKQRHKGTRKWPIQGVIARVISKSDEREARGRFEITSTITPLIIYMKKLLDSDWLRAVQFKCNTSAKGVTPVQKV